MISGTHILPFFVSPPEVKKKRQFLYFFIVLLHDSLAKKNAFMHRNANLMVYCPPITFVQLKKTLNLHLFAHKK